jgi:hypothetical protein
MKSSRCGIELPMFSWAPENIQRLLTFGRLDVFSLVRPGRHKLGMLNASSLYLYCIYTRMCITVCLLTISLYLLPTNNTNQSHKRFFYLFFFFISPPSIFHVAAMLIWPHPQKWPRANLCYQGLQSPTNCQRSSKCLALPTYSNGRV